MFPFPDSGRNDPCRGIAGAPRPVPSIRFPLLFRLIPGTHELISGRIGRRSTVFCLDLEAPAGLGFVVLVLSGGRNSRAVLELMSDTPVLSCVSFTSWSVCI